MFNEAEALSFDSAPTKGHRRKLARVLNDRAMLRAAHS
jgi:hypothetical protein